MTRTVWDSNKKRPIANGFFAWDEMDEACLREGAALKAAFHTTAVKGTPKRKAKLAGGPKNRKRRAALAASANTPRPRTGKPRKPPTALQLAIQRALQEN